MSLTASALRLLAAHGLTLEEIVAVAAANDPNPPPAGPSKAALRTRRYRERKAAAVTVTAPGVTNGAVTGDAQSVTGDERVTSLAGAVTPPVRVLPLEAEAAVDDRVTDDWPDLKVAVERLCRHAASPRLDPQRQPGLITSAGRLSAWKAAGARWSLDVAPIVAAVARKRGPPIQSWTYFDSAIAQAIAQAREPLPPPDPDHDRPRACRTATPFAANPAFAERLRDIGAAMAAAG